MEKCDVLLCGVKGTFMPCNDTCKSKRIYLCSLCHLPVVAFGRLLKCKHTFCYQCSRRYQGASCPTCSERVEIVQVISIEKEDVQLCEYTDGKGITCLRSYSSEADLREHQKLRKHDPSLAAVDQDSFPGVNNVRLSQLLASSRGTPAATTGILLTTKPRLPVPLQARLSEGTELAKERWNGTRAGPLTAGPRGTQSTRYHPYAASFETHDYAPDVRYGTHQTGGASWARNSVSTRGGGPSTHGMMTLEEPQSHSPQMYRDVLSGPGKETWYRQRGPAWR